MSNYLFLVHDSSLNEKVNNWLSTNGGIEGFDQKRAQNVGATTSTCFVSHDVQNAIATDEHIFKGTLIDYESGAVVFGPSGFRAWLDRGGAVRSQEGAYIHIHTGPDCIHVSHDGFGSVPILYAWGMGFCVVSDSMLAIVDLLNALGKTCSFNKEALLARAVSSNAAEQQISADTILDEVRYLPATMRLDIDVTNGYVPRPVGNGMLQDLQRGATDYRDGLRQAAIDAGSVMKTLSSLDGWQTNLALSGGYDSRAVLAAAYASGALPGINVKCRNSNKSQAVDFKVAEMLGSVLNFELNGEAQPEGVPARSVRCTPMELWELSSMGIYDGITYRRPGQLRGNVINVNGLGAELSRGNYGWRSWHSLSQTFKNADPLAIAAFQSQGYAGIRALGVDPLDPDASEWHYMGYRHGLHGGRGTALGMVGFMPLASRRLVTTSRASNNPFSSPQKEGANVISDLTTLLSPLASALPYDRPVKSLSFSHVSNRLRELGGGVKDRAFSQFDVLGHPADVPNGPPELFLNLVDRVGMNSSTETSGILNLARDGLARIAHDRELLVAYSRKLRRAEWRLEKKGEPLASVADVGILVALRGLALAGTAG